MKQLESKPDQNTFFQLIRRKHEKIPDCIKKGKKTACTPEEQRELLNLTCSAVIPYSSAAFPLFIFCMAFFTSSMVTIIFFFSSDFDISLIS
jgi:hypothetical protein